MQQTVRVRGVFKEIILMWAKSLYTVISLVSAPSESNYLHVSFEWLIHVPGTLAIEITAHFKHIFYLISVKYFAIDLDLTKNLLFFTFGRFLCTVDISAGDLHDDRTCSSNSSSHYLGLISVDPNRQ